MPMGYAFAFMLITFDAIFVFMPISFGFFVFMPIVFFVKSSASQLLHKGSSNEPSSMVGTS